MQIRAFFAAVAVLAATPAFAQTDDGEPDPPKNVREVYAPYTEYTFGEVDIIGETKKPVGVPIWGRGDTDYPSMIDERAHFKRDLAKSIGAGIKKAAKATETAPK